MVKGEKMKLECVGLDLSDAINKVIRATSTKTTNPILEGIELVAEEDYLTLIATDNELSIEKRIRAEVGMEGSTVVPGKFFGEYVRKLVNENIQLTLENNILTIKYTDSKASIQCQDATEFPRMNRLQNGENFTIASKDLKDLINKSIFCVSTEDSRPILKGVLLEVEDKTIKAVAVDGYRMALVKKNIINATKNLKAIVPAKSLSEISKLIDDTTEDVTVCIDKNFLMIDMGDTTIITRLFVGEFINYKQILPTTFSSIVTVNKTQLEETLDRVGLLSRVSRNNLVKFDIKDAMMELSSRSELGDVHEKLTIKLIGNDLSIDFNARYFTEALRVLDNEFLKLNFNSPASPCIITGTEEDDFEYFILPVRRF